MRYLTIGILAAALLVPGCSKDKKTESRQQAGNANSMHNMGNMHGANMGNMYGANMGNMHGANMGNMHGANMGNMHGANMGNMHGANMGNMHGANMGYDAGMPHMAQGSQVTVPKEGKKFDPPITPAQVPNGFWYCEMGHTVHYARGDKGDGVCPVCHMKLKQKKGASRRNGTNR